MTLSITCELKVNPTEDKELLKKILLKFLPGDIVSDQRYDGEYLYIFKEGLESLEFFKQWVRELSLLDTIRNRFLRNIENKTLTSAYFNRQAALFNKLALLDYEDNPPLGPVLLQLIASDEQELLDAIDVITPATIDGREMTAEEKKQYFLELEKKKKKAREKKRKITEENEEIELDDEEVLDFTLNS